MAAHRKRKRNAVTKPQPNFNATVEPPRATAALASDRLATATGAALTLSAGLLYFLTAARDIVVGDTGEFVTAAIVRGVPHAPGYPLFAILGHLFSFLPITPMPFRVNLLAVVCGAVTTGLVYFTSLRLTNNIVASTVAAAALALSPLFWTWSLVAEVFPLSNLLAATLLFLLVKWQQHPGRVKLLVAAAFVTGLALSNQQTIVLLAPSVLFILWRQRSLLLSRPGVIVACILAIVLGLLPYGYVPWAAARRPLINWGYVSSFGDLVDLFLRKSFGTGNLVATPEYMGGSAVRRVVELLVSFGLIVGPLIILGAIRAYRQKRWYFWFVLLGFSFSGPAFVAYANLNLNAASALFVLGRFFLLSHVISAPLTAFGVLMVADFVSARVPTLRARASAIVSVAVLLVAIGTMIGNYRELDESRNHIARNVAEDILNTLEPGTILLAGGDEVVLPLLYVQGVEGHRPDVTLVVVPLLPADWYLRQLRERYSNLSVPFSHYDGKTNTTKTLVEANRPRPIAVVGSLTDESLRGSFWFYQHGLVSMVEPMEKDVKLSEMASDNERLLNSYRVPSPSLIDRKNFERSILIRYASPALRVGQEYEKGHRYNEARIWFERALAIDPELQQAKEALARISQLQ
jgi:4-amino-4-deoxy-L-arabinose transferase-like glycosyltransferase